MDPIICDRCGKDCEGKYGRLNRQKLCYDCCALETKEEMKRTGRATLYLTQADVEPTPGRWRPEDRITDWTGHLKFQCSPPKVSRHNIARKRYDAWFVGPDGYWWWGVSYGDNNQIIRCKRTKKRFGDEPTEYVSPERAKEWGRTA